jgi:hypothetical protein
LTSRKQIDLCRKDLGEQYIAHLEGNKETTTPRDRRSFLASVVHHEKQIVENVIVMAIDAQEYKNTDSPLTHKIPFLAYVAHHEKQIVEKIIGMAINAQEYKNADSPLTHRRPILASVAQKKIVEKVIGMAINAQEYKNTDPFTRPYDPASPIAATSLPTSPPKDGHQPNRSTAHLPAAQSPPPCRTKRRKPTLTLQKKIDVCRKYLGEQYIAHLEENKETMTPRDRRPFLASVAHHEKKIVENVLGMAINAQEYKNIRVHAKYPGKFVEARKPRVFSEQD